MNKKYLLLIAACFAVGAFLRFVNLESFPVFADESIYVRWSQVMRAESTLRFLPLSDGKQPLFMWATIPFLKFFPDPLVAARFLSGLCGLLTIFGIIFLAQALFKNRVISLLSGFIWATLPFAVFFERMALADAMLTMFVTWFVLLGYLSIQRIRLDYSLLSGFSLGFAWLTKSPAMLVLAISPVLLLNHLHRKIVASQIFRSILLLGVSGVVGFAMYNILRLGPEFHMIAIRNQDYLFPLSEVLQHPLNPLIGHLKDTLIFFLYFLTPAGLLLSFWGLADTHKSHWRQRVMLACFWLVPIFAESFIARVYTARYILFTVPFVAIIIAHAIVHIGERSQKHLLTKFAAAAIILPSLWVSAQYLYSPLTAPLPPNERSGYLEEWTAGQGIKEVAQYIKQASKSGPVVVGSEGFFGTPFDGLQIYLNKVDNVRIVGVGVDVSTVSDKLTQAKKDNQVFLVVNSSRLTLDPAKNNLDLIATYPKANRSDGSRESLLFFKVN